MDQAHPEDREAFTSYYTIIERRGDRLVAVPYHEAYGERLQRASRLLAEAAEHAANQSLKDFLVKRSESITSDDYLASEIAWMRLSGNLVDPTTVPTSGGGDGLMGWKTATSRTRDKDHGASAD